MISRLNVDVVTNPFVGPRSIRYGESLFGRDREGRELLDLVLAHRIVLLYSPSGAGKTSLLQAGLVAGLERENLAVPRRYTDTGRGRPWLIRVGQRSPRTAAGTNRYTESTVLALDECLPPDRRLAESVIHGLTLREYLDRWHRQCAQGQDVCLIFDQFEELFTADPTDAWAKKEFLTELGAFLNDHRPTPDDRAPGKRYPRSSSRYAVLALREDFVAQLDPFQDLIPTSLRTRYRLSMLTKQAARVAVQRPMTGGVEFTDEAAEKVVNDLSRVAVNRDGMTTIVSGPTVEPVQLQVVCRRLWHFHSITTAEGTTGGPIGIGEVSDLQSVDAALREFYDEQVAEAALAGSLGERVVREWCGELVTESGFRSQTSNGPPNDNGQALASLVRSHVVRREDTRGNAWYELSHDRLIGPVLDSNAEWFESNLSPVEQTAKIWDEASRPNGLLMTGGILREGEAWAEANPDRLNGPEREFLERSRELQAKIDDEREASRKQRRRLIGSVCFGVLAIGLAIFAVVQWQKAREATADARQATASVEWTALSFAGRDGRESVLGALAAVGDPSQEPPKLISDRLSSALDVARYELASATGAALSPDGQELAEASGLDGILVFDVDSGNHLRTLPWAGRTEDILYDPSGRTIAISQRQPGVGRVTVIDAQSGEVMAAFEEPLRDAQQLILTWSPSGRTVAVMDLNDEFVAWDVESGNRLLKDMPGQAVGISADDQRFAVVDHGKLTVRGLDGAPVPLGEEEYEIAAVAPAFSPDGTVLFAAFPDGSVGRLDLGSGEWLFAQGSQGDSVQGLGMTDDGTVLWLDSSCQIHSIGPPYEAITRQELPCYEQLAVGAPFSRHGDRVLGFVDTAVKVWTVADGKEIFSFEISSDAGAIGSTQTVTSTGSRIIGRDGATSHIIWIANVPADTVALAQTANRVFATAKNTVTVLDAQTGATITSTPLETGDISRTAVSGDGSVLAAEDPKGLHILNGSTLEELLFWEQGDGRVEVVSFGLAADGQSVLLGGADGTVTAFDLGTGNYVTSDVPTRTDNMPAESGVAVAAVAMSDDSATIAFANTSGEVYRWDAWNEQTTPEAVDKVAYDVEIIDLREGRIAAAGTYYLTVWNDQGLVHSYPTGRLYQAIAFTDDARIVAQTSDGLTARLPVTWSDLWLDATSIAHESGWTVLDEQTCQDLLAGPCPGGRWTP